MRNGPILVYVETQLWELNLFLVEQSLSTEMQDSVVGKFILSCLLQLVMIQMILQIL